MGELKDLRAQQEKLLTRTKDAANKLYLAGIGAYSKAGDNSTELLDKCINSGSKAFGENAESKPKALLAGRGLLENARELVENAPQTRKEVYQRFLTAGKKERGENAEQTNELLLASIGAVKTAREEGEKLFNSLVSEGEQRA